MKKYISISVLVILLLLSNVSFASNILFKDIKPNDWYIDTVTYLVNKGGISGYPDGSFRPNSTITKAEFVKTLISSLGYRNLKSTSSHWASGYIEKAEELNVLEKDWLKNIDMPISRYEMARLVSNTLTYRQEKAPMELSKYKILLQDFDKIPATYKGETNGKSLPESVLESFVNGIVTGYPTGTFEGEQTLSRAEAATVIVRILDSNSRIKPQLNEVGFEAEVLRLVNIERKAAGLRPLQMSKDLSKVALLKSEDMAVFNYFAHTSPNYGTPFEMMESIGITYKAAGENLAVGYTSPEAVVKGWMNSPGHRANILNSLFNKIGIGVYEGSRTYWTQMFTD